MLFVRQDNNLGKYGYFWCQNFLHFGIVESSCLGLTFLCTGTYVFGKNIACIEGQRQGRSLFYNFYEV